MVHKDICKKVSRAFVQSWTNGLPTTAAAAAAANNTANNKSGSSDSSFLAQFSPTVEWYDHAFFTKRRGLESLARFRTDWLTAIADFGTDIRSIDVFDDNAKDNNDNNDNSGCGGNGNGGRVAAAAAAAAAACTSTSTAVIRCVYHGKMVGPLPGRPASGKKFRANVLILLKVNADGKIERVDEYYTANLDDGVDVDRYKLLNHGGGGGGGAGGRKKNDQRRPGTVPAREKL